MDRPPPDPAKLLEAWMEWERGETTPGRVMSNLKTAGLRDLLEEMVRGSPAGGAPAVGAGEVANPPASAEVEKGRSSGKPTEWTPVV